MRPIVFEDCAGWLHGGRGRLGAVLLGAHGVEELCSRHFMREVAAALGAAGVPALRFDYGGTGDSGESRDGGGCAATWRRDVHAAANRLKEETGACDIVLVGLRLGAILAAQAAAARSDVVGLALLAPPRSGDAYLREQTALGALFAGARPRAGGDTAPTADDAAVAGFAIPPAMREALRAFTWSDVPAVSARDALVLTRWLARHDEGAADRLRRLGVQVTARPFGGYEDLMADPARSVLPPSVVEEVAGWVRRVAERRPLAFSRAADGAALAPRLRGSDWVEEPILFGAEADLAGVYCRPRESRMGATQTFVFLNAEAIPHTGWARMTVDHARQLAAAGFASLRIDFAGVGDSGAPRAPRPSSYATEAKADVGAALTWLEGRGHRSFALVGAGSGAFQAFHAAVADARVRGLVLVDPPPLVGQRWRAQAGRGERLSQALARAARRCVGRASERGRPSLLGRLRLALIVAAQRFLRRALRLLRRRPALPSRLGAGGPPRDPLARWLGRLAERGVRILVVQGGDRPSRDAFARLAAPGRSEARALPGIELAFIEATDERLTPRHARQALAEHLRKFGQDSAPAFARAPAGTAARSSPPLVPGLEPAPGTTVAPSPSESARAS